MERLFIASLAALLTIHAVIGDAIIDNHSTIATLTPSTQEAVRLSPLSCIALSFGLMFGIGLTCFCCSLYQERTRIQNRQNRRNSFNSIDEETGNGDSTIALQALSAIDRVSQSNSTRAAERIAPWMTHAHHISPGMPPPLPSYEELMRTDQHTMRTTVSDDLNPEDPPPPYEAVLFMDENGPPPYDGLNETES